MPMPPDMKAEMEAAKAEAEAFCFDREKFEKHMKEDDLINVVLRAHLYAEHVIICALEDHFVDPDALEIGRLSFPNKFDLCVALNLLSKEWRPSAVKVNWMRN
jgi:hypothetical protein